MTLSCGQHEISLEDVDELDCVDAERTLHVDDSGYLGKYRPNTSVRIIASDGERTSLHVLTYGAPSEIDGRSAVCVQDKLVVILGSFAICVTPDLQTLLWQRRCDWGSCFGLYALPDEHELIVHGETTITKLTMDGEIVWQATGRDIFTGPFSLTSHAVFATDFDGARYEIRLSDGVVTCKT